MLLVASPSDRPRRPGTRAGRWATPGVSAIVELAPCAGGLDLCGTIRWLWDAVDEKGRPRLDLQNADASLRVAAAARTYRPVRLEAGADGGWEGQIYNPEDGQTYRATLRRHGDERC